MTILFALILALSPTQGDGRSKEVLEAERARHQGVWVVTSFVTGGKESAEELVRSITRTVEGDHVVWKREGKSFAGTTVTLDPSKSPATIDVTPDGGPRRGEPVLGIYKLEGQTLAICMAAPGKERPRAFQGEQGTGQTLMTFRRERARENNPAPTKPDVPTEGPSGPRADFPRRAGRPPESPERSTN